MDTERRCESCRYYLGNGCCRLDLEDECGKGGFEAWEERGVCMDYKLKPCPFCGAAVKIFFRAEKHYGIVQHNSIFDDCVLHLSIVIDAHNTTEAIEKWNRREPETTRRRLQVHNISNVAIPEGVSEEDFHKVMNNVVEALEHTERGESWPYDTGCGGDFCEIGGGDDE